ncbi:hypothetical protein [Streptomyces sp. NPDC005953]|uniref:hypothetical protein n=1 Tax=Streptomyces sp. NPDC005953 TaxID=3156719 RepID=UPI003402FA87
MTATATQIRDAAHPIAEALAALYTSGLRVPQVDVTLAYTSGGCVVRVADRSAEHREAVETAFSGAFLAAGWGVVARHPDRGGLSMEHPARATRL